VKGCGLLDKEPLELLHTGAVRSRTDGSDREWITNHHWLGSVLIVLVEVLDHPLDVRWRLLTEVGDEDSEVLGWVGRVGPRRWITITSGSVVR
jgi:hypothetical protein